MQEKIFGKPKRPKKKKEPDKEKREEDEQEANSVSKKIAERRAMRQQFSRLQSIQMIRRGGRRRKRLGASFLEEKRGAEKKKIPKPAVLNVRRGFVRVQGQNGRIRLKPILVDEGHRKDFKDNKDKEEALVRGEEKNIKTREHKKRDSLEKHQEKLKEEEEKRKEKKKAEELRKREEEEEVRKRREKERRDKINAINRKKIDQVKKNLASSSGGKEQEKVMKTEEEDKFYASNLIGEARMVKAYIEKEEVDRQDYDRYCDLFHLPSIIFREMRINKENPIYLSTQKHFSHNLEKGKEVEVEIGKNGKFFVGSKECTFRHQGWTIEELKKDMIPMLKRYLYNIGWKDGFSSGWRGTNLLRIKLAGNGLSNFRKSADYERTNYLHLFEKEAYIDLLSECRYNIRIEKNRVPSFKKIGQVEGKYPKIQGDYLATNKAAYTLSPFEKVSVEVEEPSIIGNYLLDQVCRSYAIVYTLFPSIKKLGVVEGMSHKIIGNYLTTSRKVYTLSPFEEVSILGSYPRIRGNYLFTFEAVYTLSPFKKLDQIEGICPEIIGNYLITSKKAYTLSPFKELGKAKSGLSVIIGNYLITNNGSYTLSPFKEISIEGSHAEIVKKHLITNEAVYTLSPFKKLGNVKRGRIKGKYLVSLHSAYTLSPFKKLRIEGEYPEIKGNYLATNRAAYTLSPFKKIGVVEGEYSEIKGNYLATNRAAYTLSPFKKIGNVEGGSLEIIGCYLVTNKSAYTLSPFKKLPIEGESPKIIGSYLITNKAAYTLSPFKKLPIEGGWPSIIGSYLITNKAAYIIDRLQNPKKPTAPYLSLRQRFTALGALLIDKEVSYFEYEMYDTPSMKSSKEKIDRRTTYSEKKSQRKKWLLPHFKQEEINTKWLQEDIVRDGEGKIYRRENFPDTIKELICCQYLAGHGAENHELVLGT